MERDDIIEYSLNTHHSEEAGVKIRKNIFKVTAILTVITVAEVFVGIKLNREIASPGLWQAIKYAYIILTLVKAGYIVLSFMHLGDERQNIRRVILAPYVLFISYLIFICITESNYINDMLRAFVE